MRFPTQHGQGVLFDSGGAQKKMAYTRYTHEDQSLVEYKRHGCNAMCALVLSVPDTERRADEGRKNVNVGRLKAQHAIGWHAMC